MSERSILRTLGTPVRLGLLGLISVYRVTVGQLAGGRCRFYPSCSAYAEEAIRELGAARGGALAAWRVVRCGPWTGGGVDHPPKYDRLIHPPMGQGGAYDDDIRARLRPSRTDGAAA
jgi:putative membrane protein insertion efficiency factor